MNHAPRWSLLLPAIAAGFALLLGALAALTYYAFEQRAALALEGKILRVAHEIENRLRDPEEDPPEMMLEAVLAKNSPPIESIRLLDGSGELLAEAGTLPTGAEVEKIEIFTGPQAGGPHPNGPHPNGIQPGGPYPNRGRNFQRGQRGKRSVEISLSRRAGRPPGVIRFLLPLNILLGLGLVGFARHSGLALEKQHGEALREARTRRMEALGRAGAGLAHQLRNPLATIKGNCQLLAEELKKEPLLRLCESAISQSRRMEELLGMLLDYARPPAPEAEDILLEEFIEEFRALHPRLNIVIDGEISLRADREHLRQILEVLFSNALAHSPEGEDILFEARSTDDLVLIKVSDRGPGPGENPEELFEPYVTTRPGGTGLGLSIARALCEANGGSIILQKGSGGRGTEAEVRLPRTGRTT